jgi:UDP-GlcNAc:undecaprenyl-phosphate/decaprenyl-phosphate GlcNAc-1-phosphate transferase
MNPFFLLVVGVAVSMLVIPLAIRLAPLMGMVDLPDPRKVHTKPIPRVGGWGIVLGSLAPLAMALSFGPLVQSFVIGALTLYLYGMWDDAKQINHWVKFSGQIFAVAVVVYYGDLYVRRFPFMDGEFLDPSLGRPFTMFAMIGMINAINHSDGLDGLAGGETMLSLIAIAFLGYLVDNETVVALAFASMGGILGFLRYNTHPAEVFMGDSGSQYLGFSLAFLAVYLTQVAHPALSPALPLLFLGLPISDIIAVLVQRIKGHMNWFKATRNHVHHRLLDLGFDHYETVVIIYSIQLGLVVSAVLMRYQSDLLVTTTYFGVIASLFIGLLIAEKTGWRTHRIGVQSPLAKIVQKIKNNHRTQRVPLLIVSVCIPLFVVYAAACVERVPRDFGIVTGVLAAIVAIEMLGNRVAKSVLLRAAIYITTVFAAYLFITYPPSAHVVQPHILGSVMIGVLAISVAAFIRFTADKSFGTTPTDYLIVFGVVAFAAFGNNNAQTRDTVQLVLYSIVLLYGCEVLIGRVQRRWHMLYIATLISLTTMAVRGLT